MIINKIASIILVTLYSLFSISQSIGLGVTDIDGNNYATVNIGSQEWMSQNLRTSKFANGESIPNITDLTQWSNLNSSGWANYNNDIQFELIYGKLYNWYSVNNSANLCPNGWHVPSDSELLILFNFLGGASNSGGKLKSTGTQYWSTPNLGATNESGFSGLPGGIRRNDGVCFNLNSYGAWWTSTENSMVNSKDWAIGCCGLNVEQYSRDKKSGLSVRCIKSKDASLGLKEVENTKKKLIKIVDVMGRITEIIPNSIYFKVYDDGTTEKVIQVQ
jgi:uncharacterized protein (TIGR02145 family)